MADVKNEAEVSVADGVVSEEASVPEVPEGGEKVVKEIKAFKNVRRADELKKKVSRAELIEIMEQVSGNMSEISNFLMQDVNTMYAQHVFPTMMWVDVIKSILIESKMVKPEDLVNMYNARIETLKKRALEEKEKQEALDKGSGDGNADVKSRKGNVINFQEAIDKMESGSRVD